MRWIYLLISFFFINNFSFGLQNAVADSLQIALIETPDLREEIEILNDLSKEMRSRDIDSASYFSERALELSFINNYDYGLMVSHYNLGIINRIRGNYDKALSHYFEALALAEKLEDNYYEMAILNAIGVVHKIHGENELALKYFNECLNQIVGFHTPEALGSIKNNISEVYLALNEYDSALKYGLASLRARTKVNDIEGQVKTLNSLSKVYIEKENFDSAKHYLNIALELSKSNNDLLGQTETQISISEVYLKAQDYDKSITHAFIAKSLAKKLNAKFEMLEVYKILTDAYSAKLDYFKAFNFQKSAMDLGDSIFNEEKEREISLLRLNREAAENELLKNKNELQEVTIQKQKVLNSSTIIILVIVFILGLVLLYLFLVKRKTNIILRAKAEELQHANVLKNKMLSIISHDVRAPLNNLYGLINLVKSGQVNEEEFQKWIGNLASQVSVTRNFLDSLLY
ncbi:MAG: tetratricopeptide repeat protein, partial [Fulvivirga sp.]